MEFLVAPMVIFLGFVTPIWLFLHYRYKSKVVSGLSEEELSDIESMLADGEKYAAIDKENRENIEIKNQAETLSFEAEKELSLVKDTISENKVEAIKSTIEAVKRDLENNDIDSLKLSLENLKESIQEI